MKFIHTADLQIGARFGRFGQKAELLRRARLVTLTRILEIGREQAVDAILIAGDMFESNQIANSVVAEAFEILAAHPDVPIVILPGNHDPLDGPGCIWLREPFAHPPVHVILCTSRNAIKVGGAVILPAPITQKVSTRDPSLALLDSTAPVGDEQIRIGMTHGALAIEGKHQPNDQPVALDAATRAGLDYLALGHWHRPQVYDNGRLAMPGTPEPDDFEQSSGSVALVEIRGPGEAPVLTQVETATFSWYSATVDLLNREPTLAVMMAAMDGIETPPDRTVLRVKLVGPVAAEYRTSLAAHVAEVTKDYAVVRVEDRTSTVLSESLWKACLQEHPLLAQVVADVEQARLFSTGRAPMIASADLDVMDLNQFQSLCGRLNIPGDMLCDDVFESMMGLLTAEVGTAATPGGSP